MQWTPAARAELSINNSGTRQRCAAGGSERAGEKGGRTSDTPDTWTGPPMQRMRIRADTRALLAFVVWLLCRSDCPSTRARRMRHNVEDKGNTARIAVDVAGRLEGTAVKVQDVGGWLLWYL